MFHIISLAKKLQKEMSLKSPHLTFSYSEVITLIVLYTRKNISQAGLAQKLSIEAPSVVTLIDKLQNQGLVKRVAQADRRKYEIVLTEKGLDAATHVKKHVNRVENLVHQSISENQMLDLFETLEKISQFLDSEKSLGKEVEIEKSSSKRLMAA